MKMKTHEKFIEEVFNLVGNEYEVLGEYTGARTKIKMKHNNDECNFNVYDVTPDKFLSGRRCPKCNIGDFIPKSHEQFIDEVYELVGDEYIVLENYINANTKIKLLHTECNRIIKMSPNTFLSGGNRCNYCRSRVKITHEQFLLEIFDLVGNEYSIIGKYKNTKTPIIFIHNTCGCQFETTRDNFVYKNARCPKCFSLVLNKYNFKDKVYDKYKDEYIVLDEYIGMEDKIRFQHNIDGCNEIFYATPRQFIHTNKQCPCVTCSKGENEILKSIKDIELQYEQEYEFSDCIHKRVLRYDFAIFNKNNDLLFLIEYDGQQHFNPVNFGGISDEMAKFYLKETQIRDEIKNEYCKINNILLLRIPYWEFDNINEIIKRFVYDNLKIN